MKARFLFLALAVGVSFASVSKEASPLGLSYIESEDVRLVYFDPTLTYLTPHALRTFTNSLAWQRRVFDWKPYERTTVLLKDFSDYGNASAGAAPANTLRFDIAPLSHTFETYPASERMYSLMNHELVHVATMDMWTQKDDRWRRFFRGKVMPDARNPESLLYTYLTVPRFIVPRWYLEGSATFMETWMGGGLGRAQGGYDEMVFRAMVRDDAPFYDPLGLVSRGTRVDFQVGVNAYLYGTRFITWLAYAHSPEKVVAWLKRDEGSRRYYADHFAQVFDLPLEQAWNDWIAFERDFQQRNLAQVRQHPVTSLHPLTPSALGSVSRAFVDESGTTLYGAFRYTGVIGHIGALDLASGHVRRLADVKGAMLYRVTSLAFDPDSETLFYTTDNYALRDIVALDAKSGRERRLLKDARIGEIAFNRADRSLWGVRHLNGLATLVRIAHPYTEWSQVHTFPYGVVPYDLDVSPDGSRLSASVSEVNGDQFLRVWEIDRLRVGETTPANEFGFGQAVPEGFVFSPDGQYVYGSSYYTGVSNIFRFDITTGEMEAVSNAETGLVRPIPLTDGRMIAFDYTGAGFVPSVFDPVPLDDLGAISFLGAALAERHPTVTTWQVAPPTTVEVAEIVTGEGTYAPLGNLGLQSAYPVLQGYKDSIGAGWRFNVEDPLSLAQFTITGAYTPDDSLPSDERGHLDVRFRYLNWRAGVWWNRSDFYDLFGPTKRSRKGYAATVGYDRSLIFDAPRTLDLRTDFAFYDQLDTLPDFQNVGATFEQLTTAEVGLHYSDVTRALAAVEDQKGYRGELVLSANHISTGTVPQLRGGFDVGVPLPMPHSSVWLSTDAGFADGDRADPFANFYFGGFGNNYVDNGAIKRYHAHYSFPGFELNEIAGRSFVRQMVEVNLPPVVFESVGTPGFYLTWLRPSVFASVLSTDPDSGLRRTNYANIGAQIDLRFTMLHWFDITLSTGYAVGYRGSERAGDEWMLSLKIL